MDRRFLLPAALVLAMAACAAQAPDPEGRELQGQPASGPDRDAMPAVIASGDGPQAAGADMDPCDTTAVQALIGEQAGDEVVEQARIDAGAEMVRTLRPDQEVTMEYRAGRLNIDVDDTGTITGLRCG